MSADRLVDDVRQGIVDYLVNPFVQLADGDGRSLGMEAHSAALADLLADSQTTRRPTSGGPEFDAIIAADPALRRLHAIVAVDTEQKLERGEPVIANRVITNALTFLFGDLPDEAVALGQRYAALLNEWGLTERREA